MPSTNYSVEDIFSPLDGDVGIMTRFDVEHEADRKPHLQAMYMSPPQVQKKASIPRKPLPLYQQLPMTQESFATLQGNDSETGLQMEKNMEFTGETDAKPKRGWRFYGTFACLAILNLICAIDATILSVALPVRKLAIFIFNY